MERGGRQRVFVSSTSLDLGPERGALEGAINQMRDTEFNGMEYFGSSPDKPRDVCLREVAGSDVYVGIFAGRYGWVEPESGISMTELEYREARRRDIPCLIYLKQEGGGAPGVPEPAESLSKLAALKQELKLAHAVTVFKNPDHLATQVIIDLHNFFYGQRPGLVAQAGRKVLSTELRLAMSLRFNLEEVRTLCYDAGVDYDDLEGGTKSAKVRELILHAARHDKLDQLLETLGRTRPEVDWNQYVTQ